MSVITELGCISGFQYGQEARILPCPSPLAKTQLRGEMLKWGCNTCPFCDQTHKDCPHLQKTVF